MNGAGRRDVERFIGHCFDDEACKVDVGTYVWCFLLDQRGKGFLIDALVTTRDS